MSFSVREVSAMLGLSPTQIRSYANLGFLKPERGERGELRFGFHDLVILRTASELSAADVPQRKVRRVLRRLREQLPAERSLAGLRITTEGDEVVVRDGASVWNPESGQALFDFSLAELEARSATIVPHAATAPVNDLDVHGWFSLACELESTSIDEAKDAYEHVLELNPRHADAHVNLGRMLHEEGAPAAAEQHYRAAIDSEPDHETAAFNLGVALEDLGRLTDAIDAYKRALLYDPDNADAHYNLAGIYERRGEKYAALRHLKAYREIVIGDR